MRRLSLAGIFALVLCVAALSAGVTPADAQPVAGLNTCGADVNTAPSTVDLATRGAQLSDAVRCLINAERTSRGLPALTVNTRLASAANGHVQEAAQQRWWASGANPHVNPRTGSTVDSRIRAANYCGGKPLQTREIAYTGAGNDPQKTNCPLGACATPAAAVNWWMNISKSGHREVILDPKVREFGDGISQISASPPGRDAQGNPVPDPQPAGTYVVNFGDCATLERPPPPPPPPPGGQVEAGVAVQFVNMIVNSCPEIGVCDWKLACGLGSGPQTEFFGMIEGDSGADLSIDRRLTQKERFPVTVTCTVHERDGPFLIFDDPVWELVGTSSLTITSTEQCRRTPTKTCPLQINQNRAEGDVTVHVFAEALGLVQSPSTTQPPPPPLAPTGCRIEGAARCGFVDFQCNVPLPTDEIVVAGGNIEIQVFRVVPELGLINAKYFGEGDSEVAVCARNQGGARCSNRFTTTFGPTFCPKPIVIPRCPPGLRLCENRCIGPKEPCNLKQ